MRTRFFIVEARRLLPLLFLLVLLISLSVYDNFFRLETTSEAPEELENTITFVTTDRGAIKYSPDFLVAYDEEDWEALKENAGVQLPDYPFNAAYEVAVLSLNGEIEAVRPVSQGENTLQVQVRVAPRENYYHVITVDRKEVEAEETHWVFIDEEDRVIAQLAPFRTVDKGEQEDVLAEDEEIEGEEEQIK
ncbi:MAG: hypothetical protein ACOYBM_03590 [Dethiobacteria bacterium]|nr:hypothetical protein [Bacillota bacterium]